MDNISIISTAVGAGAPPNYDASGPEVDFDGTGPEYLTLESLLTLGDYSVFVVSDEGGTAARPQLGDASATGATSGGAISDDFDPSTDSSQWSNITGGATDSTCGSASGDAYRFTSSSNRRAETVAIDASGGGTINFSLQMQNTDSGSCNAIESGENVVLEYSTNGSTWSNIATYTVGSYNSHTTVSETIPVGAQSLTAQFRWRQVSFSSGNYDHWSIDDVDISTGSTTTTIEAQDDFDPNQDNTQWTSLTGGSVSTACGSPTGNGFMFDNTFSRYAETNVIDASLGGTIDFEIFLQDGDSGSCNGVESGEDVVLEYSTNGSTWTTMSTYAVGSYDSYTAVTTSIPAGAEVSTAQFRWRQVSFSSGNYDHWGIDTIEIRINAPAASSDTNGYLEFAAGNITYNSNSTGTSYTQAATNSGATVWSVARGGDQLTGSINGTTLATQTADANTLLLGQIGGIENTNGYTGAIKEVVVFSSNLSATDTQLVEGYLAWKWGLQGSLPVAHPHKSVDPGQDVTVGGSGTSSPPTLLTNEIGGRNAIQFDNDALMQVILGSNITSDSVSVLAVMKPSSSGNSDARYISAMNTSQSVDHNNTDSFIPFMRAGGSSNFQQYYNSSIGASVTSAIDGNWNIYSSVLSGTYDERLLKNGTDNESSEFSSTSFDANEIFIGGTRFGTNQATNTATVDIAEIVVFDQYLSCSVLNDLEEYFSLKYGIVVTAKTC